MALYFDALTLDQLSLMTLEELATLALDAPVDNYISPCAVDVALVDVTGQMNINVVSAGVSSGVVIDVVSTNIVSNWST